MTEGERVVVRFRDGKLMKGYLRGFSVESDKIMFVGQNTGDALQVPVSELKAVFFVKNFDGFHEYVEKKAFGVRKLRGRKVIVKFSDNETLVGIIEGDLPWDKGFSLAKLGERAKGFVLTPVDGDSNNEKVFVVGSAIQDISIIAV
jgi:hypothetical protein